MGSQLAERLAVTLDVFVNRRPDVPLTTREVADEISASRQHTRERLERLVDREVLETKTVDARCRIWWQSNSLVADGTRDAIGPKTDGQQCRRDELERRVRQQTVVTELGQQALSDRDIDSLMADAANRVAATLDNDYCKVLDLDKTGETLTLRQGVGWRDGSVGSLTVSATEDDSQAAHTLRTDEPVVVEDLHTETRFTGPALLTDHDVRSGISVAIGMTDDPWGILGTHDTVSKSFSKHDVNFVQSVANILATAINRHDDEQILVSQREQLAAVSSLNEVVWGISDAVIEQPTRAEIESVVCERLAEAESYEFAWIGEIDHRSQTVVSRAEGGVENYLDDVTISVDPDDPQSEGPTGRAFRTGEIQTTSDIRTDPRYEQWRDHADAYGYRSSAAVPIIHGETMYGVLNVYAGRPSAFIGREQSVIERLGEIVGHAIAAIERKRALMSDEVVELGFHITGVESILGVESLDGRVTLEEAVPIADGEYLLYGTVTDEARAAVVTGAETFTHWESVTVRETEQTGEAVPFEARLSDPPVLSTVVAAGGTLIEAAIEESTYHMTVQLPPGPDVRQVIDAVQETYPAAEMVTRRQTRRDSTLSRSSVHDIAKSLTERQRATLRAAYYAGFFEWPRTVTGEEVAESLDIAAPTFHQHLRKGQKCVFEGIVPTLL